MDNTTAKAVGEELEAMRGAKRELGSRDGYLSTRDAIRLAPFALSMETLLGYPESVCPRIRKNPTSTRSALLWDPRDIQALPLVLAQWDYACANDEERAFLEARSRLLADRDRQALERIMGVAA